MALIAYCALKFVDLIQLGSITEIERSNIGMGFSTLENFALLNIYAGTNPPMQTITQASSGIANKNSKLTFSTNLGLPHANSSTDLNLRQTGIEGYVFSEQVHKRFYGASDCRSTLGIRLRVCVFGMNCAGNDRALCSRR